MTENIKSAIVIPDLQLPFADTRSLAAVEEYMADHKWDYYINLGDFLDYFCISRFNAEKPGILEGKTILEELKSGVRVFERHCSIIRKNNPNAKLIFLEGNHEYRATDFTHRFPHLRGIIEPVHVLPFKKWKAEYIPSWSLGKAYQIGKAYFTHGQYTNQHHAKKMVEAYEENIFYGHVHDCNSYNKTSKGTGRTKVGQAMGCLCEYPADADYTKGWPKNWQQAFGVFYFFPSGHFTYNLIRIFDHRFIARDSKGKLRAFQG